MAEREYGERLATIMSALPGGFGVMGVLVGLQQGRIGPILIGGLFLLTAWWLARRLLRASRQR
jgi:hypothetical protein